MSPSASNLLACLYPSSIEIRSLLDRNLPILSTFPLNSDSFNWIQWITRSLIAFGNSTGTIQLSRVDGGVIQPPRILSIEHIITGVFSCYGVLGICAQDSKILFFDGEGCALTKYQFDFGPGGLKNPRFYSPSILVSVVNSKACFLRIPSAAVRKQKGLELSFGGRENVVLVAYNATGEVVAVALLDGSVVISSKTPSGHSVVVIPATSPGSEVVEVAFMSWVFEDAVLAVVQRDGMVTVFERLSRLHTRRMIPEIKNAIAIVWDELSRSIIFCDSVSIKRIQFATLGEKLAFTCAAVFDYFTGVVAIPETTVYPFRKVIRNSECIAIASPKELLLVCGETVRTLELFVCEFTFLESTLVVFTFAEETYSLLVFDLSLRELYRVPIQHAVHTLFQRDNVIVIASHSQYSILTFDPPVDAKGVPGELSFEIQSGTFYSQIKHVLWSRSLGVILHLWNDRIFCPADPSGSQGDVAFAIVSEGPAFILTQNADSYVLRYRGSPMRLIGHCLFTDGCNAFSLEEDGELGEIKVKQSLFGHFMALSHSAKDFDEILAIYEKHNIVDLAAGVVEIMSVPQHAERLREFLDALYKRYPPDVVSKIVSSALYRAPAAQRDFLLAFKVNWKFFFNELVPAMKPYVLLFMCLASFDELLSDPGECEYFTNQESLEAFVREAAGAGKFLRGFVFAREFGLDYVKIVADVDVFRSTDLTAVLAKVEEDARKWTIDDDKGTLRFLGTTLAKGGLITSALAVFIALEEYPKIEALIIVDPDLKRLIREYLQAGDDQKYADGLRPLVAEPT
jgi:hypothetical protein